jgi:hypothetical protein
MELAIKLYYKSAANNKARNSNENTFSKQQSAGIVILIKINSHYKNVFLMKGHKTVFLTGNRQGLY